MNQKHVRAILLMLVTTPWVCGCATTITRRDTNTYDSLVERLLIEGPSAASASLESNDFNIYDATVEEILLRQDVAIIPHLLMRINDLKAVEIGQRLSTCWYDAPLLLRDKVRFVLRRLMDPDDYAAMIGEPDANGNIDVQWALSYLEKNRTAIASRLQHPTEPAH